MSFLSRIHDISKLLHIHKYIPIALTSGGLGTEFFGLTSPQMALDCLLVSSAEVDKSDVRYI